MAIFIFGAIVNIAMIIVMLTWTPDPDSPYMFFIVAGFWGIGDAIWQTQINGKMIKIELQFKNAIMQSNIQFLVLSDFALQHSMELSFHKMKNHPLATTDCGSHWALSLLMYFRTCSVLK